MSNTAQNTLKRVLSSFDEEDLITEIVDMHAKEIAQSENEIAELELELTDPDVQASKEDKDKIRYFIRGHKKLIKQHYKIYNLLGGVRTINDSLIDPYE